MKIKILIFIAIITSAVITSGPAWGQETDCILRWKPSTTNPPIDGYRIYTAGTAQGAMESLSHIATAKDGDTVKCSDIGLQLNQWEALREYRGSSIGPASDAAQWGIFNKPEGLAFETITTTTTTTTEIKRMVK